MNGRERFIESLLFGKPDKVPFAPGGPRESTLKRWHKEGLPEDVNWFNYLCEKIGIKMEKAKTPSANVGINLGMIPGFEEKILEHKNGHFIAQMATGEVVEVSDTYDFSYLKRAKDFVTRKWHKFPVENYKDWEDIKRRYDPESPERYPANLDEVSKILKDRDYVLNIGIHGPFWKLREWCGFENLCILMATEQDFVMEMVNFWKDFVLETLDPILQKVEYDSIIINEDMAYKEKSMISPEMARKFLLPLWVEWCERIKKSGCPVVGLDSDGYIGELIPIWIEAGINCTVPVEIAAGNNPVEYRKIYGKNIAYRGGIDKRKIAKGGKEIEQEMYKIIPPLLKDGGYIPGCDHGVPHDISLQNFINYGELLAKLTGWL